MRQATDVLLPTLGIAIAGAVVGAACGALLLAADLLHASVGNLTPEALPYFTVVAVLGAALGALAAPAIRWSLLREVPLGRALTWTAAGTLAGGAIGLLLVHGVSGLERFEIEIVALAALAGMTGAAAALRRRGTPPRDGSGAHTPGRGG